MVTVLVMVVTGSLHYSPLEQKNHRYQFFVDLLGFGGVLWLVVGYSSRCKSTRWYDLVIPRMSSLSVRALSIEVEGEA